MENSFGKLFEVENEEILNIKLFGKNFPNPIGLAAGFDKSAEVYNSLLKLGFGFVEVGTITPLKQFGNPKPRILLDIQKELGGTGDNLYDQEIINWEGLGRPGSKYRSVTEK